MVQKSILKNTNVNHGTINGEFVCIGNHNTIIETRRKKRKTDIKSEHTDEKKCVFISYTHADRKIADQVETRLLEKEYDVKRDIRDVMPWDDLDKFMRSIREQDYVVLLISDQYLHRENCIYEIYQLLKDDNYIKRIFPIVILFTEQEKEERYNSNKSISMFETEYRIELILFWKEYLKRLDEKMTDIPREYAAELDKKYRDIGNMIQSLIRLFDEVFDKKLLGTVGYDNPGVEIDKLTDRMDKIIRSQ